MFVNFPNLVVNTSRINKSNTVQKQKDSSNIQNVGETLKWEKNEIKTKKQPKWDLKYLPLKYHLPEETPDEYKKAIKSSFRTWATESEGLINFIHASSQFDADIVINWSNEKLPGRENEAGRNDLKVVNNRIQKASVTIISDARIDGELNKTERIRRTALHEIGHALGLNHSNNPKDVMFHRGINNKKLSAIDIQRLTEHYNSKSLDITT